MNKNKKIIISVIAVVVILAVLAIGFFLSAGKVGEGTGNDDPVYESTIESYLTKLCNLNTAGFKLDNPASHGALHKFERVEDSKFIYDIELNPDYEIMEINFDELKAANADVIGYLDFETPDLDIISYPVYYREGSHYYLTHNASGASSVSGELYVEGGILYGHSKTNTIIYGHNMIRGMMFGSLKKYNDQAFYTGREFFWYYTPEGKYRYQIYSVHPTPYDGYAFSWFAEPCEEYTQYLIQSKQDSIYDTGVTPMPDDEIITLCTCTGSDYYRLVVHARLVYKDETK